MQLPLTVHPLRGRRDRRDFINLPYRIYADDPHWVAPLIADVKEKLDRSRHPFHEFGEVEFFLARRGGETVGRVAALVNPRHNDFHGEKAAGFGLIEFTRDAGTAAALIAAAARFARERGLDVLRGPFGFSTNEECGTLIEGFDSPPAVMMPYNPPWHGEILTACGLRTARTLLAYTIDEEADFSRLARLSARVLARGRMTIRPFDKRNLTGEIGIARTIYNDAWEKNWGFVPMTGAEFQWQAAKLKHVLVPGLALFAEAEGEPAAFSLSLPDLNRALGPVRGRLFPFGLFRFLRHRRKIDAIRMITMGVRRKFRGTGLEGLLIHKTIENGLALGYRRAELSWILEENLAVRRIVERMGARVYKKYAIWEAPVEDLPE